MEQFLGALMALLVSFTHGGKPANLPPEIGSQVSTLTMSVNHPSGQDIKATALSGQGNSSSDHLNRDEHLLGNSAGKNKPEDNNQDEQGGNQSDQEETNSENQKTVNTDKVSTDNVRSNMQMPANIPQVAVDHSPALEPSSGNLSLPQDRQKPDNGHGSENSSTHGNEGHGS